jgi:hypothetical protein
MGSLLKPLLKKGTPIVGGQGELTCTLVLVVKTQLLEIVYLWKFDTKFSFKSIELVR